MTPKLDITQLRADRRALDIRIRTLKAELRSRWTRPMVSEQRELLACKREATQLCVLRAWARGRWHFPDHDRCREIAMQRLSQYEAAPQTEVA